MKILKPIFIGAVVAAVIAVIVAIATASPTAAPAADNPNTDPRQGLVKVWDRHGEVGALYKQCDPQSRTLIYMTDDPRGGVSTEADSPECS